MFLSESAIIQCIIIINTLLGPTTLTPANSHAGHETTQLRGGKQKNNTTNSLGRSAVLGLRQAAVSTLGIAHSLCGLLNIACAG